MNPQFRTMLRTMERKLTNSARRPLCAGIGWTDGIPDSPGVYVVWQAKSGKPVYVGETACLSKRMADIGRWRNHTCRRKLGERLGHDGSDELMLSMAFAARYMLSFLPVAFGRTEFEEYLYLRWRRTLVNSPPMRIHYTSQYDWVKIAGSSPSQYLKPSSASARR